ncbi:MAG TPA: hypothetical protein VE569_02145 [Acidimicrobiia bacterium]|nr:hypothetical protein [Acidimicrobiia bacterium]
MSDPALSERWAGLGGAQPAGLPVGVGEIFPDLVLPTVETGEPMALRDLRGRSLLLHFFASW